MNERRDSNGESAPARDDINNAGKTEREEAMRNDADRPDGDGTSDAQSEHPDRKENSPSAGAGTEDTGFLPADRMAALRDRWSDVQGEFVDDPRVAVQDAHKLVTELVTELNDTFTHERSALESQWSGGGEADTEGLRVALQRYRVFFNRLLQT